MAEYGADMWRACVLVVALLMTAAPTSAFARESGADTQNADYPTVRVPKDMGGLVQQPSGGRLKVRVFQSRQLVEEAESIEQTRGVAIDINRRSLMSISHSKGAGFPLLAKHTVGRTAPVTSLRAGDGLPVEHQIILREAAAASSRFMRQKWRDLAQASHQQAEEAGITVIEDFDRKPFEPTTVPIHQLAGRDPASAALIDCIGKTEWAA